MIVAICQRMPDQSQLVGNRMPFFTDSIPGVDVRTPSSG